MPILNYGSSVSVSVTTSSSATALPDGRGGRVELINLGSANVYARLGSSTTTVAAIDGTARSSVIIPPNCALEMDSSTASHVALIASSGTQTVIIHQGV